MTDEKFNDLLAKTGDMMSAEGLELREAAEQVVCEAEGDEDDVSNIIDCISHAQDQASECEMYEANYR